MNENILSASNIPPPPPPPPPLTSPKRFSKAMIAAVLIIVLALAATGGAYYVMTLPHDNNPGPEPSPAASTQTSPSPTSSPSATVTPSSSGAVSMGYRDGAWANYTLKNYNANGAVTANYDLGYSVSQGSINGVDYWILKTELQLSIGTDVTKTDTTYWLNKSNLQGVHYKIVITSNGIVISDTENDYSPGDFNDIPTTINPNTVISKESVTVPAGTFNCDKAVSTQMDLGKTFVTTVWGNSNIPVIGMVKQQMTQDGVLISTTELTSYGG